MAADRVPTGVPGLDALLHGGFLRGGTYIVSGPPGAGKTILANQFCFEAVRNGGRAVYLTALAEAHGRMLVHLRPLSFFRESEVGRDVLYLSGYEVLKRDGLGGLTKLIYRLVREHKATAFVLDGLTTVRELGADSAGYRELLHGIGAHNSVVGCTSLLLSTQASKGAEPEFAMVDGNLALTADLLGLKATRGIEVLKFRGSGHLTGRHTCEITTDGVAVYPRIEALFAQSPKLEPDASRRLAFGIPSLDEMTAGGLVSRSSTLIFGSPGSGKTLLALHFLAEGARRGEKGLYFGFAESGPRLVEKAAKVSLDIRHAVDSGVLRLESRVATETLPDKLALELVDLVRTSGAKRLVLDGLEPFAKEAIDPERTSRFVTALSNELRDLDATVLCTQQTNTLFGPDLYAPLRGVEAILDNIIFLRFFEFRSKLRRLLSILKSRESESDPRLRELQITSSGVTVRGAFASAESILTGQARGRRNVAAKPSTKRASKRARR